MLNKLKHASIEEVVGEITVYNFKVKDNHNYFAENILVHNADYDKADTKAQNKEIETLRGEITENIMLANNQKPLNKQQVNESLEDLIRITQNNNNLNNNQKLEFKQQMKEIKILIVSNNNEKIQAAKEKLEKVSLQIQIIQAKNALDSVRWSKEMRPIKNGKIEKAN